MLRGRSVRSAGSDLQAANSMLPGRRYLVLSALIVGLGALASAAILGFPLLGIDDANITFVYARNLVEGHGLVYNVGGERVEGFTSFAWMLVCAACHALTGSWVVLIGVNALLCVVAVHATLRLWGELVDAEGTVRRGLGLAVVTIWAAGQAGYFSWAVLSSMETALWGALWALGALEVVREALDPPRGRLRASVVLASMVLTRPEAMVVVPVFLSLGCWASFLGSGDRRQALRRWRAPAATALATFVALTLFRQTYFGYPLPNTYYAKVSTDRLYNVIQGVRYVKRLTSYDATYAALLGAALFLGAPWRTVQRTRDTARRAGTGLFLVACMIVLGFAVPVAAGGDHFGSFRFLQPAMLLLGVPIAVASARIPVQPGTAWPGSIVTAAVFWLAAAWANHYSNNKLELEFAIAEEGRALGHRLNALDGQPSLGVIPAGGIALTYEGRVLDLMGLNWVAMAHRPGERRGFKGHAAFDEDVFWTDPPDVVVPRLHDEEPRSAEDLIALGVRDVLKNVFDTERFRSEYRPGALRTAGVWVTGFFRHDASAMLGHEGFVALDW